MLTKTLSNWFPCLLLFFIRHSSLQKTPDVFRLICPGDFRLVAPRLSETAEVTLLRSDFQFESSNPIRGLYQQLPGHLSGPEFKSNLTKGQHLFEFKAVDAIGGSAICVFTITVEVVTCPTLLPPAFGEVACDTQPELFGTRCSVLCPQGYVPHGQPIECLESGSWQGHLPHCHAVTCPDPGIPLHSSRHCSNRYFVYNSSCSFTCQHGYRLLGNGEIRCLVTNKLYDFSEWSHTTPVCQKIIPPLIEECPSEIVHVTTSRSEEEVPIPEIVFRSSISGIVLNHTCNHISASEGHQLFSVGLHNITCYASERFELDSDAISRSECNFTIHVEADPCRPLPQPINGFLFCSRVPQFNKSHELGLLLATTKENKSKFIEHRHHSQLRHQYHHHSTTCRMFCRTGFVFPKTFGRYLENRDYKCSRLEGVWRPFSFVPGCVLPKAPNELKLPVEIQFNIVEGECSMMTTVSQSFLQSQLKSTGICSRNQKECLVEEWSVVCQRTDASAGLESARRRRKRKKRNFGRNATDPKSSNPRLSKDPSGQLTVVKPTTNKSRRQRHRAMETPHLVDINSSSNSFKSTSEHHTTRNNNDKSRRPWRHQHSSATSGLSFPHNATYLPFRARTRSVTSMQEGTALQVLSSHGRDRRGLNLNATSTLPPESTSSAQFLKSHPSERTKGTRRRAATTPSMTGRGDRIANRMLVRFQLATRLKNGISETEANPKKWASDYHKTVVFLQSMYHALEELLASGSLNILKIAEESSKEKEEKFEKARNSQTASTVTTIIGYAVTAQADIIPVCDFEYEFNKDFLICVPCGPNTFYDTSTGQCNPCPEGTSQPDQAQFSCN